MPAAAERFDVFLSYNSRDETSSSASPSALKRAGIEPWLDQWSLTPGGDWQHELGAGLDATRGVRRVRRTRRPRAMGAPGGRRWRSTAPRRSAASGSSPSCCPASRSRSTPTACRTSCARGPGSTSAAASTTRARSRTSSTRSTGVPFGPDAPVGRRRTASLRIAGCGCSTRSTPRSSSGATREVQRLLEKLKAGRFLAVLGPSGSGKSSLVRAGLLPGLRAGRWRAAGAGTCASCARAPRR